MLSRELPLKDVTPDGPRRALGRIDDTIRLVEGVLTPEKRRVGRDLVKARRDELRAKGFKDGIEGTSTLRADGVPFLSYVDKCNEASSQWCCARRERTRICLSSWARLCSMLFATLAASYVTV